MNQIPNIEEESIDIAIANLVFSGLSIAQMDKIPKWLLENMEKNKTKFKETLHQQLQKAREGERERVNKILAGHGKGCDPRYHAECIEMIYEEVNHSELDQDKQ